MLVLSRKRGESIIINGNIKITLIEVRGTDRVRIGIDAPREVTVYREELLRQQEGGDNCQK